MLWPLILRALGPLLRLLGLGALYAKGRSDARTGAALEAAEGYRDTRERIDHATLGDSPSPDALREFLRTRPADKR